MYPSAVQLGGMISSETVCLCWGFPSFNIIPDSFCSASVSSGVSAEDSRLALTLLSDSLSISAAEPDPHACNNGIEAAIVRINKINFAFALAGAAMLSLVSGCNSGSPVTVALPTSAPAIGGGSREVVVTPQAIPGTPRSANHAATGGYAPSNVQAQLKINVSDGTKEVKVIRDNNDPFVITKPYMLKHADPYAVRSYLEAAVGAKSVNASPAQVTAVKFSDGAGAVLVSAEEYRFADSKDPCVAAIRSFA